VETLAPTQSVTAAAALQPGSVPHLAELVRINDTLTWSPDYRHSFIAACHIIRDLVGASIAPAYLLDETGSRLELVTDDETRAILGEEYYVMPPGEHLRAPWINAGEWPVSARDHLDSEAWAILPESFKAWFGTSGIVVSIHADGRHLGAVLPCFDHDYVLTREMREFLAVAGRIVGSALYRWQVAAHEREIGALEERRRLSDELHDDLSQQVASLGLRVETMQLSVRGGDVEAVSRDIHELSAAVARLKHSLRHEMLGLRADAEMTHGDFLGQVRMHLVAFTSQFDVPVEFSCPDPAAAERVPLDVGTQLLRVLGEALTNVQRHASASRITIRLLATRTKVRLEIEDDGVGFDPGAVAPTSLGLRIGRQRMEQVDGVLKLGAAAPRGTRVVAEVPLRSWSRVAVPVQGHA
jgi:signal transduction histidine kinase